jgi:hypothetical protein
VTQAQSAHQTRTAVLVILAILALVGVAAAILFVDWRQLGPPTAQMSFETSMDGRYVRIDGTTDLPDGTMLDWDLARGGIDQRAGASFLRVGETTTAGGRFTAMIPMPEGYTGLVNIGVAFFAHDYQPPATVERFGPDGENLRGSGVYEDSGTPYLLVIREMTLS